ncbi:hypothetical protein OPV22_030597 [Ensete ventricosum]|uniref:Uncharacterized protein n=1 Tax=Ensete ventricosum TaxID=4639 RepID=A0AAV8Q0L5_ENSVE|nr:hypothetical protein OPV22_030597 [Ensete ventricosum]
MERRWGDIQPCRIGCSWCYHRMTELIMTGDGRKKEGCPLRTARDLYGSAQNKKKRGPLGKLTPTYQLVMIRIVSRRLRRPHTLLLQI